MNKNEIFALWIPMDNKNELPMLAHLSLKSMVLCGHDVVLYTYSYLDNVPEGVVVLDANEVLDSSKIFIHKGRHRSYAGFSDLFRMQRLYEYGGTWLDLDVLLIRNINEKFDDDIFICSEPYSKFYMHPNGGALRFPKHDPFIKRMLDYAEEVGDDVVHGQIGPKLINKTLKEFPSYNRYLKAFNIYCFLGWKFLNDYSIEPQKVLNKMNMDEFMGFHINNTFFEKLLTTENPNGLFEILKKSILNSNSYEEYQDNLKKFGILDSKIYDNILEWDLKYLDIANTNLKYSFKYTFLIDSTNLKKVEIYNILHSIGFAVQSEKLLKNIQVIIFGKTNLGNDKIRFRNNVMMVASEFNKIYPYIEEYIHGDYVIPLNKPIIFRSNFFREDDIEKYLAADDLFAFIFNKQTYKVLLTKYGVENLFNVANKALTESNFKDIGENIVFNYESRSKDVYKLIQIIDDLNNFGEGDIDSQFLKAKSELSNLRFKNLIDEVSYHYYTSYLNILESNNFYEYNLNEDNTKLSCLTSFYLNKLNLKYNKV